ncbi:MAG TPA: hypothetical protein VMH81_35680 [Bryobacteraceae bacterium]|nr:hypothetical protein [Bryobacteraceae bacterium]
MAAAVAGSLLFCSVGVFRGWRQRRAADSIAAAFLNSPSALEQADVYPAVLRDAPRRIYPYSIIPGGAFSKEELVAALASDPVAESHYQEFERAKIRTTRSPFVRPVYLSYRKGNQIYWTSHTVALTDGETLLTDGSLYARSRCGNRISLSPQKPVAQEEPLPTTLDTPENEVETVPEKLIKAAAVLDAPKNPVPGPRDFATPLTKPKVVPDLTLENQSLYSTIVSVLPTATASPVGVAAFSPVQGVPLELPTPRPVLLPVLASSLPPSTPCCAVPTGPVISALTTLPPIAPSSSGTGNVESVDAGTAPEPASLSLAVIALTAILLAGSRRGKAL